MKTSEQVFALTCLCDKKVQLEKRMNVKAIAKKRKAQEPVLVDVFCHGCGEYIKFPLDGNFDPQADLRE